MGKVNYNLKLKRKIEHDSTSIAGAKVARKRTETKNKQLADAVNYCRENGCRGHSALKTGLFPLIKDRQTINRRLDGKVQNGDERSYCTILTDAEEKSIVSFAKNKNRYVKGIGGGLVVI